MSDGYDYDYLAPRGMLPRFLERMESVWPNWLLEGEGNSLLPRDAFAGVLPPSAGSGFVLYRDAAMRARFHRDGGFVDHDGSAPIMVWVVGWDESLMQVDFVVDLRPPSDFLGRVQDAVAAAVADTCLTVEHGETGTSYIHPMDGAWVARNWSEVLALEPARQAALARDPARRGLLRVLLDPPGEEAAVVAYDPSFSDPRGRATLEIRFGGAVEAGAAEYLERSVVRLLGAWHRLVYEPHHDEAGHGLRAFTMPPGDVQAHGGVLEVVGPGKRMTWSPAEPPSLWHKK
jgi:hypothetical protein